MGERLRDLLGINKYALCWDFEHCGSRLTGRNDFRTLGWATKRQARRIAAQMNRAYGTDSHWIERVARPLPGGDKG